jgi:uncharacterized protein YraI
MRTRVFHVVGAVLFAVIVCSGSAHSETQISPAKIRSGPGDAWPVVATLPAGAKVNVLNCVSGWSRGWCNVRYGTTKGYVRAGALGAFGSSVEVAPVVTNEITRLHASPSLFSSVVKVIPGGKTVDMIRCKSGWGRGWCEVTYDNKKGYVRGALLARQGSVTSH